MNRRISMGLVLCSVLGWSFEMARAQETAPAPPRHMMVMAQGEQEGDVMFAGTGGPIELLGFAGMHGGKVVTGAPFSATAVTETTQTLADGNHIARKTQTNIFRDSQGRVRKEVTLSGFGPLAASGQPKSFVLINDPVAGSNFILHADTKTAEKVGKSFGGKMGGMKELMKNKMQSRQHEEIANGTLKKVDLGTCDPTVAGSCPAGVSVPAQGTQITKTIPPGQIGNEKPITIVRETWYSNDLQIVVMSKHNDPWSGEHTYTLTNIQRSEPGASLFAVPADYSVTEGRPRRGMTPRNQGPPAPPSEDN
jgi:hypothetical protein